MIRSLIIATAVVAVERGSDAGISLIDAAACVALQRWLRYCSGAFVLQPFSCSLLLLLLRMPMTMPMIMPIMMHITMLITMPIMIPITVPIVMPITMRIVLLRLRSCVVVPGAVCAPAFAALQSGVEFVK